MQPLAPYLLGAPHPKGTRLANVQKCVRTGDIDDIGDNRHLTFFQMLGNWSLGDYFKQEAIRWSYELLTTPSDRPLGERGFGLSPDRLYVTVFEGDENAPRDEESEAVWKSLGIPENRIYRLGVDDNWWSPGDNGPCGPDTEMFYDLTDEGLGDLSKEDFLSAVKREDLVEIWNDVFMEFEKRGGAVVGKLPVKNVDTGAGLERMAAVLQGKRTAYDTDLFLPLMEAIRSRAASRDEKAERIVADHVRAAVFMIADGVLPSNTDRGYVLRRLLRRAIRFADMLGLPQTDFLPELSGIIQDNYSRDLGYGELVSGDGGKDRILAVIREEEAKFRETLAQGLKEFERGKDAFTLFTTYGFPVELTAELAREQGREIDLEEFAKKLKEHQDLSRTASAGMFRGGLANTNEKTVRLHTAHHLLLAALQTVLGPEVKQRGSNITEERLRIDFSFSRKLLPEEIAQAEKLVNEWIADDLPVVRREMPRAEAEQIGAQMEFGAKYPDTVSVYFIEKQDGTAVSKEFCGGPHVTHTGELGSFRILKEEAVAQGVRRIKASLG
jgi:alanyl-tRNA synthetase